MDGRRGGGGVISAWRKRWGGEGEQGEGAVDGTRTEEGRGARQQVERCGGVVSGPRGRPASPRFA